MLNRDKHKNIMLKILKEIYSDTSIGPLLGFKGGTAAMLFYELDRFSVDLDFDLLDGSKEQEVFDKIEKIASKIGEVKEARIKRYTIFFLLSYGENEVNIKIEISRRNLGSNSKYSHKNFLGMPMLVMDKGYMFANKLVALVDRKKLVNRDIYDIWFFLDKLYDFNYELIEDRSRCTVQEHLNKCIKCLENVDNRFILDGLGELVTEKQKYWIKEHLLKDTIFGLRLRLKGG